MISFLDFWAAYTYVTVLVPSYAYNSIYGSDCVIPLPKATELRCSFQDEEERNEVGSCREALAYLRIQTCASPKMGMLVIGIKNENIC